MLLADPAGAKCNTSSCEQRVAKRQCSQARPVPCIRYAALKHRQSFRLLLSICRCESGLDPLARNPSGSSGLAQFLPSTWATTPYVGRWIFSARWNALAAAWLLRAQGTAPWTASRHCWTS